MKVIIGAPGILHFLQKIVQTIDVIIKVYDVPLCLKMCCKKRIFAHSINKRLID